MSIWEGTYKKDTHLFFQTDSKNVREIIIKNMDRRVWHGGKPSDWPNDHMYYSAPKSERNLWHLDYFMGKNPYERYRKPEVSFDLKPRYHKFLKKVLHPFPHQKAMADHWYTRKRCHLAAQMRTGKSLPALSIIEHLGLPSWIVAPRSAIAGLKLEMETWGFPEYHVMTYERLRTVMAEWTPGSKPPPVVLFDEFSKAKTYTTLTAEACRHLTSAMREEYEDPYILGMSGTPAPDKPTDWWSQIEIIQPGYIAENHPSDLRNRLAIVEKRESDTGGFYPHILTWLDDPEKCAICGEKEHPPFDHPYRKSENEVGKFAKRLEGMTKVFFWKDCMDLPEKTYERRILERDQTASKYSKLHKKSITNAAIALNRMRQISSGFLYEMVGGGDTEPCKKCGGTGTEDRYIGIDEGKQPTICNSCGGTGQVDTKKRSYKSIPCPKDDAFKDILDEHEECGRLVAYGSFQQCIDRMVAIAIKEGWKVIRVDGRGWHYFGISFPSDHKALAAFKEGKDKIVFIAHPASGGMGISLSASPTIMFWDNSFNGADRLQAVERGSDAGMDLNKGCKIIDLIHLPVDKLVLDKLEAKESLQNVTMGDIEEYEER